jgi:hypothetical protein
MVRLSVPVGRTPWKIPLVGCPVEVQTRILLGQMQYEPLQLKGLILIA